MCGLIVAISLDTPIDRDRFNIARDTMRHRGFNVTPAVEKRMTESLKWAVAKARRRGLKHLPAELLAYS